jgi:predicted negative regulator of RcsB-dependent stress response
MKQLIHTDQRGIAHLMTILAVVVIVGAGFVGWWVWQNNQDESTLDKEVQQAIKNAK